MIKMKMAPLLMMMVDGNWTTATVAMNLAVVALAAIHMCHQH